MHLISLLFLAFFFPLSAQAKKKETGYFIPKGAVPTVVMEEEIRGHALNLHIVKRREYVFKQRDLFGNISTNSGIGL
jgi:hypothetical protein